MTKNILIMGGLGYISHQLLELYREDHLPISLEKRTFENNVTILDNRFVPLTIKNLALNMKFVQGDIRDKQLMTKLVKNQDIIYNLAAHTGTKTDPSMDDITWQVNAKAPEYIIDTMPDKCKFVFASSGNVFGGHPGEIPNAKETDKVYPKFTYAKSKVHVENYLAQSGKNYVVCRFGANYGFGHEMRMGLVGNTFARITAQSGIIKLIGGGNNLRPLTHVQDSARALHHLGENNLFSREIFHCNAENKTIKDIANICKSINKKVQIVKTDDEIPFASYGLCNRKLLRTGFVFRNNIESAIKHMVNIWKGKC